MSSISITLRNGSQIPLDVPAAGQGKSCFFVGVQKGGSTLLTGIAKALARHADLSFYSIQAELISLGIPFVDLTADVEQIFMSGGYCYGGFRGIIDPIVLPDFASGRTIFLARDPRDMVTSQYFSEAISHTPPGSSLSDDRKRAFDARRERVREMQIDDFVVRRSTNVVRAYETAMTKLERIDHRVYRYEDVVFDKREWVADIARYLDIDVGADDVEAIARPADVIPEQEDASNHIRKVTPGDHKEKLLPATIAQLDDKFSHILNKFGYE